MALYCTPNTWRVGHSDTWMKQPDQLLAMHQAACSRLFSGSQLLIRAHRSIYPVWPFLSCGWISAPSSALVPDFSPHRIQALFPFPLGAFWMTALSFRKSRGKFKWCLWFCSWSSGGSANWLLGSMEPSSWQLSGLCGSCHCNLVLVSTLPGVVSFLYSWQHICSWHSLQVVSANQSQEVRLHSSEQ